MATATSPAPEDRSAKRLRGDEERTGTDSGVNSNGYSGSGQPPPQQSQQQQQQQQRFPGNHPYGGPPPPGGHPLQQSGGGYGMWGPQYGNGPPPHHPQYGPPPPGSWQGGHGGYRSPPPQQQPNATNSNGQARKSQPNSKPRKDEASGPDGANMNGQGGPPSQQQQQQQQQGPPYWNHGPGPGPTQWQPQHQYGPPPPGSWQGGPTGPPMHQSMFPGGGQGWPGGNGKTPPRPRGSGPREVPFGGPRPHELDISYLQNARPGGGPSMDDDGQGSSGGGSAAKEKGRGSYKCGRCGVPKKGHVCPYQPKLKRRPDEPPPETRHAAVQVEMDEFMTLRRLNIRIQGFPESYATGPHMSQSDMVVGEPHAMPPAGPPGAMLPVNDDPLAPASAPSGPPPPPQPAVPAADPEPPTGSAPPEQQPEPMDSSTSPAPSPQNQQENTGTQSEAPPTENQKQDAAVGDGPMEKTDETPGNDQPTQSSDSAQQTDG